jgi:hypothetical protein
MAKKVKIVGAQPKRVCVLDKPGRRIEPAELAAAIGAQPDGEQVGANLDPISLAELGTELLRATRSRTAKEEITSSARASSSSPRGPWCRTER